MQQKTNIILFFICLFCFINVSAQDNRPRQTIKGIVIDKASGVPLPSVTIGLLDMPQMGTITDDNGRFSLAGVPVGRHDLQATSVGYETSVFREIMVTSAKEINLEIQLKENTHELGEVVVVSQTNKDQPLNKMALSGGRMLSVEEARRYAGGMDDPARLASSFAGGYHQVQAIMEYLFMGMHLICCNGGWRTWKFRILTISPIFLFWVEECFRH